MNWRQILMMKKECVKLNSGPSGGRNRSKMREKRDHLPIQQTLTLGTWVLVLLLSLQLAKPRCLFVPLSSTTTRLHQEDMTSASVVEDMATGGGTVNRPIQQSKQVTLLPQSQHKSEVEYLEDFQISSCNLQRDNEFEDCLDHSYYEYEQGQYDDIKVKGRLQQRYKFWEIIGAPDYILSIIKDGYIVPMVTKPQSIFLHNNKSALKHSEFVEEAILQLLHGGCIQEWVNPPSVVNPLSVSVQPNGKKRLILDLRHVNKHVWKEKIKFEDYRTALQYIEKQGYMFSFDLKSGYHHIDIHSSQFEFLGFSWNFKGKTRHYVFTVLPFGISSAPYIFTKVMRVLVKYWRLQGISIVVYLDDGWSYNDKEECCRLHALLVKADIISSGFVPNKDKSIWIPTKNLTWLGFIWNLRDGHLEIPQKKLDRLKERISELQEILPFVSARQLARVVGLIISMSPVSGNITRIKTRYSQYVIKEEITGTQS